MRLLTRAKAAKPATRHSRPRPRWYRVALPFATATATIAAVGLVLHESGFAASPWQETQRLAMLLTARGGFTVETVEIEGRHRADSAAILKALGLADGISIFAVDPALAKLRLEQVPWVRTASVYRDLPGKVVVRMVEQEPLAFWQRDRKLMLIDRDGRPIATDELGAFAILPVLVGDDAPREGAALLDLLVTEPDLAAHVTAAVRVGARRWNLHFDQGVDVEMPEDDAAAAWHRLAKIEKDDQILERDVTTIDLRLPDRIFLKTPPELNIPEDGKRKPKAKPGRPA